jgi:hypothetical protein
MIPAAEVTEAVFNLLIFSFASGLISGNKSASDRNSLLLRSSVFLFEIVVRGNVSFF